MAFLCGPKENDRRVLDRKDQDQTNLRNTGTRCQKSHAALLQEIKKLGYTESDALFRYFMTHLRKQHQAAGSTDR